MINIQKFYDSWHYLNNLEAVYYNGVNHFSDCLDIKVVKVCESTEEIDVFNEEMNTKVQVWLEFGKIELNNEKGYLEVYHDTQLDCGGDTLEEAIITLANLCKIYGYKERETNDNKL